MKRRGLFFGLFGLVAAMTLVSCGGDTPTGDPILPTSVTISGPDQVAIGQTITLTANVYPANATNKAVTWSTTDTELASISSLGVVTGLSVGNAIIEVTSVAAPSVTNLIYISVYDDATAVYYNVTFDKGYETENRLEVVSVREGRTVEPISVSRTGYYLLHWAKDGVQYDFSSLVMNDFGLVAIWEEEGDGGEFEQWINTWSQPGHMYFHYKRLDGANYEKYALWLWQNKPKDLEGALYGYAGTTTGAAKLYPMTTTWMTNIGGTGRDVIESGKVLDIDLNNPNIVGGKTNVPTSFQGATQMGFLIPQIDSMGGGAHWVSDGGANTYIKDFDQHFRANGSIHIFVVSGQVDQYRFTYSDDPIIPNPTVTDTTGQYRSAYELASQSMIDRQPAVRTSSSFKELGVGYQVFVASFRDSNGDGMGDINGVRAALPYLEDLGVKALWLTPVQDSESYHGYDVTDYETVDSKFGTMADYEALLSEAHAKGMKVVMDLVINHTSKNNIWFKKSQKAVVENGIKYRDLYHWKYKGDKVTKYQNGSYIQINVESHPDWYRDGESNYYYFGKFGSGMVELNYDNQATRDLVIDAAKFWMNKGVDGFRLDAIKHIYMADETVGRSNDIVSDVGERTYYDDEMGRDVTISFDYSSDRLKNVNFWKEFSNGVKAQYPDAFLVGENFDGWDERMAPYYEAMDSEFDFGLYYHLRDSIADMTADGEADEFPNPAANSQRVQSTYNLYKNGALGYDGRSDFINSAFTSNHDTARAINKISQNGRDVSGTATEVGLAQYHAASTMLQRGVSWIYYGDELGMSGNLSQHKGKYGSDNSQDIWYRQPLKWGDASITTGYKAGGYQIEWDSYNKNTLKSVEQQKTTDGSMLKFYQELGRIKNLDAFPDQGAYNPIIDNPNVYAFNLYDGTKSMNVYINSTGQQQSISMEGPVVGKWGQNSGSGTIGAYGFVVTQPTGGVHTSGWSVVGSGSFINGGTEWDVSSGVSMTVNTNYVGDGTEYMATISFKAGDVFKLTNGTDWITSGWETEGTGNAFSAGLISLVPDGLGGNNVKVLKDCRLSMYFKVYTDKTYSCWIQSA